MKKIGIIETFGQTAPHMHLVVPMGLECLALVTGMHLPEGQGEHLWPPGLTDQQVLFVAIEQPKVLAEVGRAVTANPEIKKAWPPRIVHALQIERRADLTEESIRALASIPAKHHALVITPREAIDISTVLPGPGGGGVWLDAIREVTRRPTFNGPNLVIVRGVEKPIHPAWVAAIRDACKAAGAHFVFTGWGDYIPEQCYPPEINGFSKRHREWVYGNGEGPRPERVGAEGIWWDNKTITDWGAMDTDEYVSQWTGWADSQRFCRVGEHLSGRMLDGREHLELPEDM